MGKLSFTLKIFIIVLVAFIVLQSWGEVITRSFIEYFDLDKEDIKTWLILGTVFTILLFIIVFAFNLEFHDLFGISETVDIQLTGTKEKFKNGKLKHYSIKK